MSKLTLFHYWRSSCSWRVRWALALKGVAYEAVPVNILTGEPQLPAYVEKNPTGLLPALSVDGRFFGESLAIIEWLEETYPTPSLYPKDPLLRMSVRQMALVIATGTQPLQNPSVLKFFTAEEAARKPQAQHWIAKGLATYESLVRGLGMGAAFSAGDGVTLADLCLIPQVYNALRFEVDLKPTPLVRGIYERCLKTPACDQAAPHNQPGSTT